jgi:aminoglycoside phosphotransferase (APT) family kinase protein
MTLTSELQSERTSERLASWLTTRLPDGDDVSIENLVTPQSSGFSYGTVIFDAAWTDAGGARQARWVARVEPRGRGLFPAYDLGREQTLMSELRRLTRVPVPEVLFYEPDPAVLGSPFLVMEWIDGRALPDDPPFTSEGWVLDLPPRQQLTMYESFLSVLAELHATPWQQHSLDPVCRTGAATAAEAHIEHCERYLEFATDGQPNPTLTAAIEWLRAHRPTTPEPRVLCWGDARFANVLVGDDLTIAAALDWERATLASPELDLGYFLYALRHHTDGLGLPMPSGFPGRSETVARYEQLTGHTVVNLEFYEALGGVLAATTLCRLVQQMMAAGFIPADSDTAVNNSATQLLARMLDLPSPRPSNSSWVGRRSTPA